MKFKVISQGINWGIFESEEKAYQFAVNHIKTMKLMCGDIYIPYRIMEVK